MRMYSTFFNENLYAIIKYTLIRKSNDLQISNRYDQK